MTKSFPRTVKYILFDLDGTLADTGPDMAYALNQLRQARGLPPLEYGMIRPVVSLGGAAMIYLAFNLTAADPEFETTRRDFLDIYRQNIYRHTRLFAGMDQVLDTLEANHSRWGIVTNKPGWLTAPLLKAMKLDGRAGCVVSGDTLPYNKPRPEPLLHACGIMGCQPVDTAYIGDARRDIEAGKNAGMTTAVARYGYIETGELPDTWGADTVIDQPVQILEWLRI
jgi:phosphoglycolate phosphatase